MTLPNFLIIGAAKSGTTSLASYLKQHPDVFIPKRYKEPNFFFLENSPLPPFGGPATEETLYDIIYRYSVVDEKQYQGLFSQAQSERALGEASVPYLYYPQAPVNIKQRIPGVRLVAVLRNPIDRLYSHYLMVREKYLLEPLDLREAIAREPERIRMNWGWDWHYVSMGMYYTQLKRYFDLFEPEQIEIFLYEDFCRDPLEVVQSIYRHIDVDDRFIPDMSARSKTAKRSRSLWLSRFLHSRHPANQQLKARLPQRLYRQLSESLKRWNHLPIQPLPEDIRVKLSEQFRPEILRLQDLIARDLSHWLVEP